MRFPLLIAVVIMVAACGRRAEPLSLDEPLSRDSLRGRTLAIHSYLWSYSLEDDTVTFRDDGLVKNARAGFDNQQWSVAGNGQLRIGSVEFSPDGDGGLIGRHKNGTMNSRIYILEKASNQASRPNCKILH